MRYVAKDQYNGVHVIYGKHPRKALLELFGKSKASKMYRDDDKGNSKHIGYVIGGLWLRLYKCEAIA